jgi:hypothetical protein
MKVTEEIEKMLPENWKENFKVIDPKDIKVGDYIAYVDKPRAYSAKSYGNNKGGFKKGGFITFVPDLEKSELKGNKDEVFGFRQYAFKWSVNANNILLFLKTTKDVEELLNKGKKRSKKSNEENRKESIANDELKLEKQLEQVEQIIKNKKRKVDEKVEVPIVQTKDVNAPPKKRGRKPKSKIVEEVE